MYWKNAPPSGYVSTILGRRRAISGIRRGASRQRNLPERTAINTVIQGSAADLIKLAMIDIHRRLRQQRSAARMLLQIHDELVFEVPADELDALAHLVSDEMVRVLPLDVSAEGRREVGRQLGASARPGAERTQGDEFANHWAANRRSRRRAAMQRNKPRLIGLVGGIASGKSYVAEQFERLGAAVVSADASAHEVLKLEEVKRALARPLGQSAFSTSEVRIDRRAVAKIVFAPPPDGPRELAYLESVTHPRIGERLRCQLAALAEQGSAEAIVLDVPLLAEGGWNEHCVTRSCLSTRRASCGSRGRWHEVGQGGF